MGMTAKVDVAGIEAMFDAIEADVQRAVRPAAQAAAQVLYEVALDGVQNTARSVYSGPGTGNLRSAIYQVYSERKSEPGRARYEISWNAKKAPHGHLVEFGHIQRYAVNLAKDGRWYTVVKPSMRGKPKPKRSASQAVKDSYYVLRKGGPQQIAAKPFMRPVFYHAPAAVAAARAKFFEVLGAK